MKGVVVQLTFAELWQAAVAGCARRITSIKEGYDKNKHAEKSDWATDIDGACAELAFAKHIGAFWDAGNRTFKGPDVTGDYHVRSTRHKNGCLILRPNDRSPGDSIWILGIVDDRSVRLVGWLTLNEAKSDRFRNEKENNWYAPQEALHGLDDIP